MSSRLMNGEMKHYKTNYWQTFIYVGDRVVKFGIHIGSDWPQLAQIWDFLRSVSVHFGSASQNVLKLILKSPRFVLFWTNLTNLDA